MAELHPRMKLAAAYLKGMAKRGELLPGVDEKILGFHDKPGRGGGAADVLKDVLVFLHGDMTKRPAVGSRWLNPEYQAPAPEMPLRSFAARLEAGGALIPGGADRIIGRFAADLAYFSTSASLGNLSEALMRRLGDRSNEWLLTDRPPHPFEDKVRDALQRFAPSLAPGLAIDDLARAWADLGNGSADKVARAVAERLEFNEGLHGDEPFKAASHIVAINAEAHASAAASSTPGRTF